MKFTLRTILIVTALLAAFLAGYRIGSHSFFIFHNKVSDAVSRNVKIPGLLARLGC
jgi:hypothetical protein